MAECAGHDGNAAVSQGGELENTGEGAKAMEGAESEDEEDVFEVESILDSKTEGVRGGGGSRPKCGGVPVTVEHAWACIHPYRACMLLSML